MTCLPTGVGTTLTFSTYTAEIRSLDGFSISQDSVEKTNLASTGGWREFCPGLKDAGEVTIEVNFDPNTDVPHSIEDTLTITWPLFEGDSVPASWACEAHLSSYEPSATLEDTLSASVTFKLSGEPTFTDSV